MTPAFPPPVEAPWPARTRAWWVLAVFFLAGLLSYTDRFILGIMVDPIRADLKISDTEVSLLQGLAFAVIYSFAGVPLGRFADILPRRAVIMAGVVIWSFATAACGLAHGFGQLFTARVFVGIGEAALAPAAVSMIADYFPPNRRGAAIGVFLMGMAIGSGASILIGGNLLQAANAGLFRHLPVVGALAPWRSVLVLLAIPGVLILALLLTVGEPQRREHWRGDTGKPLPLSGVVKEFAARAPVLAPLYLGVAMMAAGNNAFQNWTPALLSRRFGMSPGEIGQLLGVLAMTAGAFGSLAGGLVSDRMQRHGTRARLTAALLSALVGLIGAGVAFAGDGLQVVGFFTLWLLMGAISQAIGITLVQDLVPNAMRGVGASLVSFFDILIGLSAGTTLTAVFTEHVYRNPKAVGLSISTVALISCLAAMALYGRARAAAKD